MLLMNGEALYVGELAHSHGLNISDSVEYHRKYMTLEEAVSALF
jgi:hypothetical protein